MNCSLLLFLAIPCCINLLNLFQALYLALWIPTPIRYLIIIKILQDQRPLKLLWMLHHHSHCHHSIFLLRNHGPQNSQRQQNQTRRNLIFIRLNTVVTGPNWVHAGKKEMVTTKWAKTNDSSSSYGKKCRYAHGDTELRWIDRDSRYKTRICRAYHVEGTCLYGSRCTFIHNDTGRDVIGVDANKSLVQASSSGGFSVPKTRQRSRFFVSDINDGDLHHGLASSAPIATRSPTKTMWDPTLGLGMQPLLDHSTLGNQRHHPYTGNLTAPTASTDKYDRRPHLPSLASPLSLASSSSFCSSSFSSSTSSLSSIKTIGNHQASHLDSFGALDPMTVAILSVETKRSTSWNNYTTTTADSETNGNMVMGHIHD